MLQIFYNKQSNADIAVKLTIKDNFCKAEVADSVNEEYGIDIIENMLPYNSYILTKGNGIVKNYRKINTSNFNFLDMNRLGVAIKMDFAMMSHLYGTRDILQVDTGVMSSDVKDIVIRLFECSRDMITVEADQEFELLSFNTDDLVLGDHPRMSLWDSYSLTANGAEFMANRKGVPVGGEFDEPIIRAAGSDHIEFTITKYKGAFAEKLTRDIDDEEVMVESSCGVLDTRRVKLVNGIGKFKLFSFGYEGPVKIKLGRKWYEVWNDYRLLIGAAQ